MRATFLFILVLVADCTSSRLLTDPTFTQENLREQLNVEHRISVFKKDGEEYRFLYIDAIEEDYLLCHNSKYENLIIPYLSIQNIEIEYPDTGKTIGLVIVVPLAIIGLASLLWVVSGGELL